MQTTILFTLPIAWADTHRMDASDWRGRWVSAGVGTLPEWNHVRVVAVRDLLWVIASEPAANEWIKARLDGIAAAVVAVVGDVVPFQLRDRALNVRSDGERLWGYRFPRLVVAKSASDWGPHFKPALAPELLAKLTHTIEAGVCRELRAWGRIPRRLEDGEPFLVISQPGRPVPIKAIHADRSGHGKPVEILARAQIVVLSPLRIEGEIFVGPLASLGFGRMLRGQVPEELDVAMQRSLLSMPNYHEDIAP